MGAASLRGETPFPQAGEGVFLQFKTADKLALQHKFGDSWFVGAFERCDRYDMEFIVECLKVGGKKDGKPFPIDPDTIEAPLADVSTTVLNALYMSTHGKTYPDYLMWLYEKIEAEKASGAAAEDPSPTSPEVSSSVSEQQPSGQG